MGRMILLVGSMECRAVLYCSLGRIVLRPAKMKAVIMGEIRRWIRTDDSPLRFTEAVDTFSRDDMHWREPGDLLTTEEVADVLGVTQRRVQAMIADCSLPATRYGRFWLVRAEHAYARVDRRPGRPLKIYRDDSFDYEDNYDTRYDDWDDE